MTPRERWESAVELQHAAVRAIEAMPADASVAAWEPTLDVINAATQELVDVAREHRSVFSDEEWRAAYSLHRDALIAANRRRTTHAIAVAIEAQRADSVALYERARSHLA